MLPYRSFSLMVDWRVFDMRQESTFKIILKSLRKRVNLRTLLVLVLLLAANSYAWFIYNTKVDVGLSARVQGWSIIFTTGETDISEMVEYDIAAMYPGMETYRQSISVNNRGDTKAVLSHEIISVSIMGEKFYVNQPYSSEELLHRLATYYPFKINMFYTNGELAPDGISIWNLDVSWAFESGDDELDTYWGTRAYHFHQEHPNQPSIRIELLIRATQSLE